MLNLGNICSSISSSNSCCRPYNTKTNLKKYSIVFYTLSTTKRQQQQPKQHHRRC